MALHLQMGPLVKYMRIRNGTFAEAEAGALWGVGVAVVVFGAGLGVAEGPRAARTARPEAARELEREQRRDEQQKHEEHNEHVAVQACSTRNTV